ncbi:F-box domain-containing protein [Plectosphaerella plurivora]|uniref:F-box domain-containing protein n=1 Tax=Plectosphaerella plurivora TaxID=936078 RepID=A0A9P8VCY0_9PEZI|nr:F-box domain-containing protein [Plectosphaerella plurivora]
MATAAETTSTSLLTLPPEILHDIFTHVEARDLGRLPCTCRALRDYVTGNVKLFKDNWLSRMDTPKRLDQDWTLETQNLVRLQAICSEKRPQYDDADFPVVYQAVTSLLANASAGQAMSPGGASSFKHAPSHNAWTLARLFYDNEPLREAYFTKSSLFRRARRQATSLTSGRPGPSDAAEGDGGAGGIDDELWQKSARLHCLFGRPILNAGKTRSSRMHPFACSKVYDIRQYTTRTHWGPFRDDGSDRVDWEKVEAILIVLGTNLRSTQQQGLQLHNIWDMPFAGSWGGSWMPTPGRTLSDLDARDPYGISGTWLRVVCFVDYGDFSAYNFEPPAANLPRHVARPPLDVEEAVRFILMTIKVTGIDPPGEEDGQDLPVVRFEGRSRSLDDMWDENANSELRGTCRLTKEGEVRWTTFSVYGGEDRWRSESVQVGGVRSTRGVLGNWFDAEFSEHGPVGPTAFWKLSDPRPQDEQGGSGAVRDFFSLVQGITGIAGIADMSDEEFDADYVMGEFGEDDEEDDEEGADEEDTDVEREMLEDMDALAHGDVEIIDLTTWPPTVTGGQREHDEGQEPGQGQGQAGL